MISSVKTELHAYAWDEGEQPVEVIPEVPTGNADYDDNALQRSLMRRLETKEYGKFVRIYPGNAHVEAGEIALYYRAFTDEHRGRIVCSGINEAELAESYQNYKLFCAQKVFTPAELYALKPARVDSADWHTINVHLSAEVSYFDMDHDAAEAAKRMETRTLVDHDYDGRRGWTLQTVWFDGMPVMVVNSSGRDGDEYHDRWITDLAAFGKMVAWLRTFTPPEELGYAEADAKIPAMTEFYNHTIHDYYDVERQEPRKKV